MSGATRPEPGSRLRDEILPPLLILACALAGWEACGQGARRSAVAAAGAHRHRRSLLQDHDALVSHRIHRVGGAGRLPDLGRSRRLAVGGDRAFALPRAWRVPLRDRVECHPDHRHHSSAHDLVRLRHCAQDHDLLPSSRFFRSSPTRRAGSNPRTGASSNSCDRSTRRGRKSCSRSSFRARCRSFSRASRSQLRSRSSAPWWPSSTARTSGSAISSSLPRPSCGPICCSSPSSVLAALGVELVHAVRLSRTQGHSRRADRGDAMSAVLIRDVLIVPPSGEMPFHGWVTVDDGKIADVGRGRREPDAGQSVIEGGGAALIPGLVNTHAHSHSSLTRGSAEGLPLEKLAGGHRARAGAAYRRAGLCRRARDLCGGAAVWHDHDRRHVHPPEPALAAARDIGIRAVIVPYVADTKPFAPTLEQNARLLEGADDTEDRVRVWVGLHDLESCSDDSVRAGAALARAHGTGLHLHCSETRLSVERTRSRVGRTPIAHLLELGALDDRHSAGALRLGLGGRSRAARDRRGACRPLSACQSQARVRGRSHPGHARAGRERQLWRPTAPRPTIVSTCST